MSCPDQADDRYVDFGDVARGRLGMQCQYASRYLTGVGATPALAQDLRWHGGDPAALWRTLSPDGNYHALRIHADDVEEFVARADRWRRDRGIVA
jgi:hypothetical protein